MQNGPTYKAISIDLNNASPEQQQLFKNVDQFFEPKISELMQLLGQRVFMNKDLKIDVKFQSNLGRATLEKDSTRPHYQLTLSANARPIDTLFDFVHALYDINSRTFDQKLTGDKFLDHRFHNAFRKTFEAMQQMFSSELDYASLGIDNADLEHLRNAIPGQSHLATELRGSVAKDFTLKTMAEEEKEYLAVSKDESGTQKISIFTKKPEYSINSLKKPSAPPVIDLKAQAQASKSQVFVDRENNAICCSICAQSGTYSIVVKTDLGYYCDRGGYINESAVLEAQKFLNDRPQGTPVETDLQRSASSSPPSMRSGEKNVALTASVSKATASAATPADAAASSGLNSYIPTGERLANLIQRSAKPAAPVVNTTVAQPAVPAENTTAPVAAVRAEEDKVEVTPPAKPAIAKPVAVAFDEGEENFDVTPAAAKPTVAKPAATKPTAQPAAAKPVAAKPVAVKPATAQTVAEEEGVDEVFKTSARPIVNAKQAVGKKPVVAAPAVKVDDIAAAVPAVDANDVIDVAPDTGPAFNADVLAQIERILDADLKALARQRAKNLPAQLKADLLGYLNADPVKAAKFLAQEDEGFLTLVKKVPFAAQKIKLNNLPEEISLNGDANKKQGRRLV